MNVIYIGINFILNFQMKVVLPHTYDHNKLFYTQVEYCTVFHLYFLPVIPNQWRKQKKTGRVGVAKDILRLFLKIIISHAKFTKFYFNCLYTYQWKSLLKQVALHSAAEALQGRHTHMMGDYILDARPCHFMI